jgi:hypothetical protein
LQECSAFIFKDLVDKWFVVLCNKVKAIPVQAYYRPIGFQELEAARFQDSWHMKVVKLSALHTSHFFQPGNIPGTHFC